MIKFIHTMTFFVTLVTISTPTWARFVDFLPVDNLVHECFNNDGEIIGEVYKTGSAVNFIIGFKLDNDDIGALFVEKNESNYRTKKGSPLFNLNLNHKEADQYQFSVFEAELTGNG